MRRWLLGLVVFGCSGSARPTCPLPACGGTASSSSTAVLVVLSGRAPYTGGPVVTHRADGSIIAQGAVDANGCAVLASEPGALVSVLYQGYGVSYGSVTSLAPASGKLVVHVPEQVEGVVSGCVAGSLDVERPPPPSDVPAGVPVSYRVDLGCGTGWKASCVFDQGVLADLPMSFDVPDDRVGPDGAVYVAFLQYANWLSPQGMPMSRSASGVTKVKLDGGHARLTSDALSTLGTSTSDTPCSVDPSLTASTVMTQLNFSYEARGVFDVPVDLASGADHVTCHAVLQSGQPPDPTFEVESWIRSTQPVVFGADDFLPTFPQTMATFDEASRSLALPPALTGADATRVHIGCNAANGDGAVWDVVLPPDLDHVVLPTGDPFYPSCYSGQLQLGYIDSDDLDGYQAVLDAGLYTEIVTIPPVAKTRLRTVKRW